MQPRYLTAVPTAKHIVYVPALALTVSDKKNETALFFGKVAFCFFGISLVKAL